MLALHPRGFKYIITSTLTENNNQAGRGDLVCHWEGTDVAVQEMFSNVRLEGVFILGELMPSRVGFDNIRRTRSCCACLGNSHSTITTAATAITSRPSQATLPLPLPLLPLLPLPPPPRELLQAE